MADIDLAHDHRELSTPTKPLVELAKNAARQLAQGIVCGRLNLAFTFDWARQIVDSFELVSIPRAPGWVLGAVNINGAIVPVVDLDNYFFDSVEPAQTEREQRLLIGGIHAEDAEAALAVVFSHTPTQLEYSTQQIANREGLPPRLLEVCRGIAKDGSGKEYLEIDSERLMDALSIELSVV